MSTLISTERLGWPRRRWWRVFVPWETQRQLRYEIEPDRPTATCHLQLSASEHALCGYPWEGLVEVPGTPSWSEFHPEMRCNACTSMADEDPDLVGPFRFTLDH